MHYLVDLTIRVVVIYAGIAGGFFLQKWSQAEKAGKWLLFVGLNILTPILLLIFSLLATFIISTIWKKFMGKEGRLNISKFKMKK